MSFNAESWLSCLVTFRLIVPVDDDVSEETKFLLRLTELLLVIDVLNGENLDLVLGLTISQPSSSGLMLFCLLVSSLATALVRFSTDLGAFRPLTVSAQLLFELEELMDEVEPNGGTVLPLPLIDDEVGVDGGPDLDEARG